MLGSTAPYDYIHSFWSDQYEHKLEYVGHATKWDEFVVRGSLEDGRLIGFYLLDGLCRPPSASTAGVTPSWTPTRDGGMRPPRCRCAPDRLPASSRTRAWTCGRSALTRSRRAR